MPVRDESGWAVRLVGAVSDVTERKERERELQEALDQQTATAEVLQVINSSPGDLAPVFDAMLEKALGCAKPLRPNCDLRWRILPLRRAAQRAACAAEFASASRIKPGPGTSRGTRIRGASIVHTADVGTKRLIGQAIPAAGPWSNWAARAPCLTVALRKDGKLLGVLVVYRQEVRPFTGKQIALLQSFAAQAVIAMENARLLNELRDRTRDLQEALEYQTATSDVLKVINSIAIRACSRCSIPMLVKAAGLCVAHRRSCSVARTAMLGARREGAALRRYMRNTSHIGSARPLRAGSTLMRESALVQIADMKMTMPTVRRPCVARLSILAGVAPGSAVPLRKGEPLGRGTLFRQEVRPFTEKQIALVQNFRGAGGHRDGERAAAQRTARPHARSGTLEYQTAISDVLKVISRIDLRLGAGVRYCREGGCGCAGPIMAVSIATMTANFTAAAAGIQPISSNMRRTTRTRPVRPGTGSRADLPGERSAHVQMRRADRPGYTRPSRHARAGRCIRARRAAAA